MGKVDVRRLKPPEPLADRHQIEQFRCSEKSLDQWLRLHARGNEIQGASRTYVVCSGLAVVGYYCLGAGAVAHQAAASRIKRNMPDPIPAILLGRLAVHEEWTHQGIGAGMLKDAILRSMNAAEKIGVRALLCHALTEPAKAFYMKHGFVESPISPRTLVLPLSQSIR